MAQIKHVAAFRFMIFPKYTLKSPFLPLEHRMMAFFLLESKNAIRLFT